MIIRFSLYIELIKEVVSVRGVLRLVIATLSHAVKVWKGLGIRIETYLPVSD